MKKQMLAVLVGAVVALPVVASAQSAYIGLNAGKATQKVTVEGDGSAKDDFNSYKLYGGYNFNNNFGIEGGYAHLGTLDATFISGGNRNDFKIKARSIYLAAVGTLPINEQFALFAKAGLSANRVKVSWTENGVFQGSGSESRTSPMFGLGAKYNFSKSWSVVAEYENYGKTLKSDGDHLKTHAFSLGARYSF